MDLIKIATIDELKHIILRNGSRWGISKKLDNVHHPNVYNPYL